MSATHATRTIEAPLEWSSPEAKLWVANREGEFAGYVEFREGHYAVTDGSGRERAPQATLRDAQRSLAPGADTPEPDEGDAAGPPAITEALNDADVAAAIFAGEGDPRVPPRLRRAASARSRAISPSTRALAVTAIALAGAALGTLAVALNVLQL